MQHEKPNTSTEKASLNSNPWSSLAEYSYSLDKLHESQQETDIETNNEQEVDAITTKKLSDYKNRKLPFDFNERVRLAEEYEDWYEDMATPLEHAYMGLSSEERIILFANAKPLQQLEYLSIMDRYIDQDQWNHNYGRHCKGFSHLLSLAINDETTSPLIKTVSEYFYDHLDDDYDVDTWYSNDGPDTWPEEVVEFEKKQAQLRERFPLLDDGSGNTIKLITPHIAASSTLMNFVSDKNEVLFEDEPNLKYHLQMLHATTTKIAIEAKTGLKLEKIPLTAQLNLFDNMMYSDNEHFDHICSVLNANTEDVRTEIASGFFSAQYGKDFGDSLLAIGESKKLNDKEKRATLYSFNTCHNCIQAVTDLYQQILPDEHFHVEYSKAANERLVDAITVFSEIAKNGYAEADLGWAGNQKIDYHSAFEAIKLETKSLHIIANVLSDIEENQEGSFAEVVIKPDTSKQCLNRTMYNLYSPKHGYVLLYTRPGGSHTFNPTFEYGKERSKYDETASNIGVEASMSITTNPVDPFSLPNPFKPNKKLLKNPDYYDEATMNKVSAIRLDREGRAPGMAADDIRRDPVSVTGTVSVDLAAIGDRADTPSGKIARLIATGNAIRAKNKGLESSLNHNINHFDQQRYGSSKGFAALVHRLDAYMQKLVKEHPPKTKDCFTEKMKEYSQKNKQKIQNVSTKNRHLATFAQPASAS